MNEPAWQLPDRVVALDRPFVLGILNVTPDSFSDGGRHVAREAAVDAAVRMVDEGADAIDVGGESTRPGATAVDVEDELRRVIAVIEAIRARLPKVVVSVDTVKAAVAARALDAGAQVVNDVSGLRLDPAMGETCARHRAGVILMHSRGAVQDMATFAHATYDEEQEQGVVAAVERELASSLATARSAGIRDDAVVLDPGIGFAKRPQHSLAVLGALDRLATLGRPLLVGVSRKRFIGEITGVTTPADRIHGTTGANVAALCAGARLFRVHDVRAHREALDVAWAVLRNPASAAGAAR